MPASQGNRHFKKTLLTELDLMHEAANACQLKRNFSDNDSLYIPKVYWEYTKDNILTTERKHSVNIREVERLQHLGVDLKYLAEKGVELFFTQVLRDSFFHADMHPGNLFVDATNPQYPGYIAVDFGIMGSLNDDDQRYIAENLHAFFKRDYRRVAELHIESGWLPEDTRVEEFEAAIRAVSEPIFAKPLKDISFGKLLLRLFQTAHKFKVVIQPQLIRLQKTLLNIESLGRQLYPDLNLWETANPFIENWLKQKMSPK